MIVYVYKSDKYFILHKKVSRLYTGSVYLINIVDDFEINFSRMVYETKLKKILK